MSDIPPDLRALLVSELAEGEVVRWLGQPDGARIFWRLTPTIPLGLLWIGWTLDGGGFGVMVDQQPSASDLGGLAVPLVGLLSVAVGIWLAATAFNARYLASRTLYAVTDQRVIKAVDAFRRTVRWVRPGDVGPTTRRERRNGSGSIRIETHSYIDGEKALRVATFELEDISDVARVDRLLRELRPA